MLERHGPLTVGAAPFVRTISLVLIVLGVQACACGSPWTARVCTSDASGNCRAVSNGQATTYNVTSELLSMPGAADVMVRDANCRNGIGEVDVKVVKRDQLQVTVMCLVDAPVGSMTLPPADAGTAQPSRDGGN